MITPLEDFTVHRMRSTWLVYPIWLVIVIHDQLRFKTHKPFIIINCFKSNKTANIKFTSYTDPFGMAQDI